MNRAVILAALLAGTAPFSAAAQEASPAPTQEPTAEPGESAPGDIIVTGTPTGAGARFDPPIWLRPGDVVGLEALATGRYDSEAAALTDVTLCRIPTEVVHKLNLNSPRMHAGLLDKWHKALREADDWLASINFGTAQQRVCQFILKMRHTTDPAFVTLFSREDMGAMMDLKQETVSREISALVKAGALQPVDKLGRLYRIMDESLLQPGSNL